MEIQNIVKNRRIALYGLGTETERIIREWSGAYKIVGLLDSFRTEGEQFGYPIVPIQDVVKLNDIIIVVVARPGSCKAIAKKIGSLCRENNIELYDIRGNNLLEVSKVVYDFRDVKGYKRSDVLERMKEVAVVSFDMFDTLLVRNVTSQADVIAIVDARLKEQGVIIDDFCNRRIAAEKKLSQGYAPKLCEIYEELLLNEQVEFLVAEDFAKLEYETDLSLLEVRAEVVELIKIAKSMGKQVCITTDMYYSKAELEAILEKNKIDNFDELLVSCEHGIGKANGLFDVLIQKFGTKDVLHIGDDMVADIDAAQKYGIRGFKIFSSVELFDTLGGLGLLEYETSLSDRIKIGMFLAKVFNSPFVFENEKKNIQVEIAEKIGYLFCAPMILDFSCWFEEQLQKQQLKNVWFGARDGYLLKKVVSLLYPNLHTEYFLTSRTVAIRSGVETEADIAYVDSMKFSGTEEENLWKRFGIHREEIELQDIEDTRKGMLKYTQAILTCAENKRQNYLQYVKGLNLADGGIAFFDFVAKGTTQMFLEKILAKKLAGLYFLQLEQEFMKDKGLDIQSFYTEDDKSSVIFDNYYILETILTSPEPSVEGFSATGEVIYAQETRTNENINCVMKIQIGILDYVADYMRICPKAEQRINKKMSEVFLALLHNVEILEQDFLQLKVEDPFFNRETDIVDVL